MSFAQIAREEAPGLRTMGFITPAAGTKRSATSTPADLLALALDSTNLVWRTGGSASWFAFTAGPGIGIVPYDTRDAAASGQIGNDQESWIETEIATPGTLVFWWSVDSQFNGDGLHFVLGGTPVASIRGTLWWHRQVFDVPAGTLRWVYSKDGAGGQGRDRGYLDAVAFYPSKEGAKPEIVAPPTSTTVEVTEDVVLAVGASGEAPFHYQWHKDGAPLAGATQSRLPLREITLRDAGSYHVTITNRWGSVASAPVTVTVSTARFDQTLDTSRSLWPGDLAWATGGDKSWFALTIDPTAYDKVDSAASGAIGDNQQSWIERTVIGPRIVNFWWKVSSERDADFLRFEVGDVEYAKMSGEVNWRQESFQLPAGAQRLRWRYTKNDSISAGQDRGWLDQVAIRLLPEQLLAAALNSTNLVWRTGGSASWFDYTGWTAQEIPAFDRGWAARSGAITDNQRSWLETDVSGPGALVFWWSVSSQTHADFLRFLMGGTEMASISGNVGWEPKVVSLSGGSQTLRWEYVKDGSGSGGSDRGALDQVTFVPFKERAAPTIIYIPGTQFVVEGSDVSLPVVAVGAGELRYQWYRNATPVAGATNSTLVLRRVRMSDAGTYQLEVSNADGSVRREAASLIVGPSPLASALDAPGLLWSTGGNASWFAYSTFPGAYNSGVVGSGAIADGQTSWISTTVMGPGVLQFQWRVSSEPNDGLRFFLGDTEIAKLSGEVNWRREAFVLPAGEQNLRWEYTKDSALSAGTDRGWLDHVVLSSGSPVIVQMPQFQFVVAGDRVAFAVVASGIPPLSYQWRKDGKEIVGATNSILDLGEAQVPDTSQYSVTVSNALGVVTTPGATWSFALPVSLAEALDSSTLGWTTGGGAPWFGVPRGAFPSAYDGLDAAKSGWIAHGQESWIQTTAPGPSLVRFSWKVSSEAGADSLRLFLDGEEAARIAGEADWRRETISIPHGEHVLRWQYSKNATGSAGLDRAWLDQVEVLSAPKIAVGPESQTVWEGNSVTFNVVAVWERWLGYQWLKDGNIIPGETRHFLPLSNVSASDAGQYSVIVRNDVGTTMSASATLVVRPRPDPMIRVVVKRPNASIEVKGKSGQRYVVESTDSLASGAWRVIESIVGDGTTQTFQDNRPVAPTRFYRLRLD